MDPADGRTSGRNYLLGIAVLVAGALFLTVFLVTRPQTGVPDVRMVVPGEHEVALEESGKYTVFYEYTSVVGNRSFTTREELSGLFSRLISRMVVTVAEKGGSRLAASRPPAPVSYDTGDRAGVSVLQFEVEEPGAYVVNARYSGGRGRDIVLAIGQVGELPSIVGAVALYAADMLVGGLIIAMTLVKRRAAKRALGNKSS